jgi:hypothetical protein
MIHVVRSECVYEYSSRSSAASTHRQNSAEISDQQTLQLQNCPFKCRQMTSSTESRNHFVYDCHLDFCKHSHVKVCETEFFVHPMISCIKQSRKKVPASFLIVSAFTRPVRLRYMRFACFVTTPKTATIVTEADAKTDDCHSQQ